MIGIESDSFIGEEVVRYGLLLYRKEKESCKEKSKGKKEKITITKIL